MSHKILWKIEELWNKFYSENYHSQLNLESFSLKLYKNNKSLYNSDFNFVSEFNFNLSEKPVHSDDYGKYLGLERSQILEKDGKLIYLFDNHNKIIRPFLEYAEITGNGFDVVHVDAHNDDALFFGEKIKTVKLENVTGYIHQTRISDFFDFMSESNIIQNIHRYTKSSDFESFIKPENPYILSLDIDIFGSEGNFTDLKSKVKIIAEAWQHADVVCIAMSPGFIDQIFAKEIIKIFISQNN